MVLEGVTAERDQAMKMCIAQIKGMEHGQKSLCSPKRGRILYLLPTYLLTYISTYLPFMISGGRS